MERDLAVRMLAAIESLTPALDEATRITQEMGDPDEAKRLRHHLGKIMTEPLFDLVMHIIRQYPELDPDRARR